ncbi:MAG: hypothetical protein ACFE7R_02700 [Candidatus Hodarchaeota archaeon]
MKKEPGILNEELWNASDTQVSEEILLFIEEFGSFTPEWFVDIKFHLLRSSGLTMESRDEFCQLSTHYLHCPKCDFLYTAKKCLLWLKLFRYIRTELLKRAPPCIRNAWEQNNIKSVADYFVKANLISPPFYKVRSAPSCKSMKRWGYCTPDEYCEAMERENTLAYSAAREHVRRSRNLGTE